MPIFKSKLGIFGSYKEMGISVWVHLTECFAKINKPQVSQKCFIKALEEIAQIIEQEKLAEPKFDRDEMHELADKIVKLQFPEVSIALAQHESTLKSILIINKALDSDKVPLILEESLELSLIHI